MKTLLTFCLLAIAVQQLGAQTLYEGKTRCNFADVELPEGWDKYTTRNNITIISNLEEDCMILFYSYAHYYYPNPITLDNFTLTKKYDEDKDLAKKKKYYRIFIREGAKTDAPTLDQKMYVKEYLIEPSKRGGYRYGIVIITPEYKKQLFMSTFEDIFDKLEIQQ